MLESSTVSLQSVDPHEDKKRIPRKRTLDPTTLNSKVKMGLCLISRKANCLRKLFLFRGLGL